MKPELLSPAGDWPCLHTAVEYGADAVYFGLKGLNMRHYAGNFESLEQKKIMSFLHDRGKKGYLVLNTIVYNHEIKKVKKILEEGRKADVDGVILWDMAVLALAKEMGLTVHLSTQASAANFSAVRYYYSLGVKRIILARECTLPDIKDIITCIRDEGLDCQIETFVHGALCLSLSGRCFLSQHSFARSANRGQCLQPCRREYLITDVRQDDHQYIVGRDYVLSPKDVCALEIVDKLIEAGIAAFKIEGRMRSPEYVKEVTSVYRQAIDAFFNGGLNNNIKKDLRARLELIYNRGLSGGFFLEEPQETGSRIGASQRDKIFLGEVVNFYKKINVAAVLIKNIQVKKGQEILIYGKNTPARVIEVAEMQIDNKSVTQAGRGDIVGIKLPFQVKNKDKVFLFNLKTK